MTATTDKTNAREWEVGNDEYHDATQYVGNSALKVFRKCPHLYHAIFIEKSIQTQETEALLLGSWLHMAVLEPGEFVKVITREKLLAADKKRLELVASMKMAIEKHPQAAQLLSLDGDCEKAILWTDTETGIELKCKPDKVAKLPDGRPVIPDLKTTIDPSPEAFAKQCMNFGYHCGAALYKEGFYHLHGEEAAYVHIAIGKSKPHSVVLHELNEEAIILGHRQNRAALSRLSECRRTGDWSAPHERQINKIGLPRWAFYSDEWEA